MKKDAENTYSMNCILVANVKWNQISNLLSIFRVKKNPKTVKDVLSWFYPLDCYTCSIFEQKNSSIL